VVLGEPEAVEAEGLGLLGELAAAVQRGLRRATLRDLCQVEHRERHVAAGIR
jgi:hypothetical protein